MDNDTWKQVMENRRTAAEAAGRITASAAQRDTRNFNYYYNHILARLNEELIIEDSD